MVTPSKSIPPRMHPVHFAAARADSGDILGGVGAADFKKIMICIWIELNSIMS